MAESEEQSQVQASDVPGSETSGGPAKQPQGGKKGLTLIIVIVVFLLIFGAAGAAVYFIFIKTADHGLVVVNPEDEKFAEKYEFRKQSSIEMLKPDSEPVFSAPYDYTVNMRDGKHMMKIAFQCLLYEEAAIEYLKTISPVVDDTFLEMFKNLRPEDLRNRAGLELLKINILRTINSFFTQEYIDMSLSKDRHPIKEILIIEYYIN